MSERKKIIRFLKAYVWENLKDVIIAFILAVCLYKGLGLALGTDYPMLVVVSCSMVPTLERGDVIIVKGVSWDEIVANEKWKDPNSTIIVYYEPLQDRLIVHRAYKKLLEDSHKYVVAWGDNNSQPDPWLIPIENVEGKVIYRIPYLGYPRLWLGYLFGEDVKGCNTKIEIKPGVVQ